MTPPPAGPGLRWGRVGLLFFVIALAAMAVRDLVVEDRLTWLTVAKSAAVTVLMLLWVGVRQHLRTRRERSD